jgi:enoyl-CoA hydratase/carnithine racemase
MTTAGRSTSSDACSRGRSASPSDAEGAIGPFRTGRTDEVVDGLAADDGTALDGARALAAEILGGSPTSVRASLQIIAETEGIPDTVDAVTQPSRDIDELLVSEDMIEGVTAFAQKRIPRWRNR